MGPRSIKAQLSTTYMLSILAFSFMATVIMAAFWVGSAYLKFQRLSDELEYNFIGTSKEQLVNEVDRVIQYLAHEKASTEKRLRANIKARVYEAHGLAEGIYHRNRGRIADGNIRKMVIEALRSIRFNMGRGYFFITGLDGVEHLFADKPELEGRNLLGMQDTEGRYVIRDMISLVRAQGEGYYRYNWTKPGAAGKGHPKIAYIKYFEPFDWFIGTGEYLEDVERDIQAEVLARIEQIRFGQDGYIFVGTYDGVSLAQPAKNRNMWDIEDENGVKIVQELIARARSGGGFVNYVMPKFEGLSSAPKLSYADKFDPWGWYVGAGVYIDEIHAVLAGKREELGREIRQHLVLVALAFTVIAGLTLLVARLFTRRLRRSIASFARFFEKASTAATPIDTNRLGFGEFEHLAAAANQMISERQRVDQAFRQSLEWNQTIFNAVQSGIVVIDAEEHRVVDVNPAAADMFGRSREEIIGRTCHEFICSCQGGQCPILDLGQHVDHEEQQLVRPDASVVPILKTVGRIDIGPKPYLIEVFLDISKQKKLEGELQQAQKMEAIGTLTGGIAHDFNNILGIIMGNTELAQTMLPEDNAVYPHLVMIREATLRAKKIVIQLLDYSRQNASEMTVIDLKQTVDESIGFIRPLIPSSIDIRQHLTEDDCWIRGNATQIHQVLINLCVNASHAVDDESGFIEIRLARTAVRAGTFSRFPDLVGEAFAEIVIRDNGHGIAPEIQGRIFDPYFTTKAVDKGTGMGLSVVLGIVRDHDGAIDVSSQPSRGTSVRMVLPLTTEEQSRRPTAGADDLPRGAAENILFIDDEEMLVRLGKDILEHLGYRVEGYTDATQAITRFKAAPEAFDLIISDMTMPGMNGAMVVAAARAIRADIPVIICSGYNDKMNASRAGALDGHYIAKPIEMKKLAEAVHRALVKNKPADLITAPQLNRCALKALPDEH